MRICPCDIYCFTCYGADEKPLCNTGGNTRSAIKCCSCSSKMNTVTTLSFSQKVESIVIAGIYTCFNIILSGLLYKCSNVRNQSIGGKQSFLLKQCLK